MPATFKYNQKQAFYIIDNIQKAHVEDGFNELVPEWHEALIESENALKNAEQTDTVQEYIKRAEHLLKCMPLLELHPLKLNQDV